jgi:hypothetical protein
VSTNAPSSDASSDTDSVETDDGTILYGTD